jgi:hypothetical protein
MSFYQDALLVFAGLQYALGLQYAPHEEGGPLCCAGRCCSSF